MTLEGAIRIRCDVEATVAQRVEGPVATLVVLGKVICEIVDERFQGHGEIATEEPPRDGQSLILGDDLAGQVGLGCHDLSPVVDVDESGIGVAPALTDGISSGMGEGIHRSWQLIRWGMGSFRWGGGEDLET